MEKSTATNEITPAEAETNPDEVFHGDALVVDYLTTLLTSTPAKSLESSEINMIHLAIEAGWKLVGESSGAGHSAPNFESELSKLEAETLKNENKNLKFKTELAHIDAQVLRGENKNLRTELSDLKAQLLAMQGAVDTLRTENNDLKSMLEAQQNQPTEVHEEPQEATAPVLASEPEAEPEPADETGPEAEFTEPGEELHEAAAVLDDEPEPVPPVPHNVAADEPVQDAPAPAPEAVIQPSPPVAEDRAFIARTHFGHSVIEQKPVNREVVVISRTRPEALTPFHSAKPASKIIKQSDIIQPLRSPESEQAVIITITPPPPPPPPVQQVVNAPEADIQPPAVEPPPVPEQEQPVEEMEANAATPDELLHQDSTGDIDVPAAPAPKVVVRRNVMNYEDLQKEADSSHTPPTGHTIIL
jgi:hypothetical protein